MCIAVPEDPSGPHPAPAPCLVLALPSDVWHTYRLPLPDPLQTNWTKDGKVGSLTGYVNPIVNDTGRDPSTAWKTPAGMSS